MVVAFVVMTVPKIKLLFQPSLKKTNNVLSMLLLDDDNVEEASRELTECQRKIEVATFKAVEVDQCLPR